MFAKKPFKKGFIEAKKALDLKEEQIAVVRRSDNDRHNWCKQDEYVFNTHKANRPKGHIYNKNKKTI